LALLRVLSIDEPEERLACHRSVCDELDAELLIANSGAGNLGETLQDDYAVIIVNLAVPGAEARALPGLIRNHPRSRRTPLLLIGGEATLAAPEDLAAPVDHLLLPLAPASLRMKLRLFVQLAVERRLRREAEELSRLKDEFLASMSHELRTPLNAILGWTSLLRSGRLDPPTAERALETVERNARAQKRLIEDLLDISRIVSGKVQLELTEFDPRQVLESALATMTPTANARRITLTAQLPARTAAMRGDFSRLQQVVCNLLSNAIKFTPEGGQVWLRLDRGPEVMQITITDTGQGISPEFLPLVFDRFRQEDGSISRRHGGLGLGLAIVRHLVELHGGTVAADSPGEGQGATFTVSIPARGLAEVEHPPPAAAPSGPDRLAGITVLVVDDDPGSREVVAGMLQAYGARVTTADSGERAWELLLAQPPDVLIADLAMPRMTGLDLIQRLRQRAPSEGGAVPAIAVSAYASAPDRGRSLAAGFNRHISKPVGPEELVAVVINALAEVRS